LIYGQKSKYQRRNVFMRQELKGAALTRIGFADVRMTRQRMNGVAQ